MENITEVLNFQQNEKRVDIRKLLCLKLRVCQKNLTMEKPQLTLTQLSPTTRHIKDNLGLHLTTLFHRSLALLKLAASLMCTEIL
jgi:hypothetical protein